MPDYGEIIKRLEEASGEDRIIDGEIACAIFKTVSTGDDLIYRSPISKDDWCAPGTYWHVSRSGRSLQTAPCYTGSLDDAATLCPAKHDWSLHVDNGEAMAGCMPASEDGCDMANCDGATPAIALCLAFLRARSMEESNG